MRYLAPSDTHTINVPVIVGAEYTVPTADGKLITRIDSNTTTVVVPVVDSSTLDVSLQTPTVASGELKILSVMLTMPTQIGQLNYRENFGIIDLMDIPATGDSVRKLFGLNNYEIPDEEMDLEGKYLSLYKAFINDFHTKRQTDQYLTKLFGDLISIVEALSLAPSLIIRIDKKRSTENGEVTRFGDAGDLAEFIDDLNSKKATILDELDDFLEDEALTSVAYLQFVPMYNHATGGQ